MYGFQYSAFIVGAGLSPVLIARLRDATGGYEASLWASVIGLILVAALLGTAPAYDRAKVQASG